METAHKLLCTLVKDFSTIYTASSLARQLNMSRWGVWKIIKKLEKDGIIVLRSTGAGKTSTQTIHLDWKNALTKRTVSYALALEAEKYRRWRFTFAELEKKAGFVLLFGSILHSPQTAGDIDLLAMVSEKELLPIEKCLQGIQRMQEKKIHSHLLIAKEFAQELRKRNKVFLDALRRGVVLFGQEKFIENIQRLQ